MRCLVFSLFFLLAMTVPTTSLSAVHDNIDKDSLRIVQDIEFIWQSKFTKEEKIKTRKWVRTVAVQSQKLLGKYPFKLRFFITRKEQNYGPLVGCYAKFGESVRGVYLGIDPRYPEEDFMKSWKTPHEISHLALPALGKQNAWFFEGFATYMSRQILAKMGYYTTEELNDFYLQQFASIKDDFNKKGTFVEVIRPMIFYHNYTSFYWGGASYFYQADKILKKEHHTNLCKVVREYQKEKRLNDTNILMVIKSWDSLVGSDVFSKLMRRYRNTEASDVMKGY